MPLSPILRTALLAALPAVFLFASCRKTGPGGSNAAPCTVYTEVADTGHLVSPALLSAAPQLIDTLARYLDLQLYRATNNGISVIMHCHVFYHGLKVFTDNYMIAKNLQTGELYIDGEVPQSIGLDLQPVLTYTDAIAIARRELSFGAHCLTYRLGIYDINASTSFQPVDYRLVWYVASENAQAPYVTVDAHNGTVYGSFDGIWE